MKDRSEGNPNKERNRRGAMAEAMSISDNAFRAVFENVYDAIFIHDVKGKILDVNQKMLDLYHVTKDQALRLSIVDDFSSPDNPLDQLEGYWKRVLEGASITFPWRARRPTDGSTFEAEVSLKKISFAERQLVLANVRDVTLNKAAEAVLIKSEENFRVLVEFSQDAIGRFDRQLRHLYVNPTAQTLFGFDSITILGKTHREIGIPDPLCASIEDLIEETFLSGRAIRAELQYPVGTWIDLMLMPEFDSTGQINTVIISGRDITERKRSEKERLLNEQRMQALLKLNQMTEATSQEITDFSLEEAIRLTQSAIGYLAFLNDDESVLIMHSWSRTAMAECRIGDKPITYPLSETGLWGEAVRQRKPVITNDYEAHSPYKRGCPEGHVALKRHMNIPVFAGSKIVLVAGVGNKTDPYTHDDAQQVMLLMDGMWRLIERKHAMEALSEKERQFQGVIRAAPTGIGFSIDRVLHQVNERLCEITGYTEEELIGLEARKLYDTAQEYARVGERYTQARSELITTLETKWKRKDGTLIDVLLSLTPITLDDSSKGVTFSVLDITEYKKAASKLRESEEKLARSKKMESLGLLAGGVAHDLNNVLSGMVSYPELLLMTLPEDSDIREPIKVIEESGRRAVAIVQDLLAVARGVAIFKEPLNLNDTISIYLDSPELKQQQRYYPDISIVADLDPNLLNMKGSHVHLVKAITNLVTNAFEAIGVRGHVTISTQNCYLDRPIWKYEEVTMGEYVVLSVSDNGPGISSVDLDRIFEPFYTKKVMGRSGTGLGLSVVWSTIQDHNAYIDVSSSEKGTTFELFFPATREDIAVSTASLAIEDIKGNGEVVLVVDDIESQRIISRDMLHALGYKAAVVSGGEKAVEFIKENPVDLVLLDMIMDPGINGRETYERIINVKPAQKAIISSGFSETEEVKKTQQLGAGRYLKKPFTLRQLGSAIKEELLK